MLKHVLSTAAKAELVALFYSAQNACILRKILEELVYPHPPN
jgi:hypothetical protein